MGLDIYLGRTVNVKSIPVATLKLPSDLIEFLNANNIFIDEYGTYTLQNEQMAVVEKLVNDYSKTGKLEKKYLDSFKKFIEIGKSNSSITLVGD